jgi:hypothetical protein
LAGGECTQPPDLLKENAIGRRILRRDILYFFNTAMSLKYLGLAMVGGTAITSRRMHTAVHGGI